MLTYTYKYEALYLYTFSCNKQGEPEMKNVAAIIIIAAFIFLGFCPGSTSYARGGGHGGGHGGSHSGGHAGGYHGTGHSYHGGGHYYRGGGYRGGPRVYVRPLGYPYYGYPYYYTAPYYPYPYGEQQPYGVSYCRDPQGYYPDVTDCPGGWIEVVPPTP